MNLNSISQKNGFDDNLEAQSFHTTNKELQETHEFIYELDQKLIDINSLIINDLMDKSSHLKNTAEGGHDNSIKRLSENYTLIKEHLSEISMFKVEVLDKIKEKILSNILQMQQYYGMAMGDIVDGIYINFI
jgi:hypothetical protein